jgi:hypothetical protein
LSKQHSPTLQRFLTFFVLVITFAIHAGKIIETFSESLLGKKEPLNFSWTMMKSQFFLLHLQI